MTIEEWLGEENQLGMDIWTKKYCQEGEDFEIWLNRISGGNQEIAEYIRQKKFLFGGGFCPTEACRSREERSHFPTAM